MGIVYFGAQYAGTPPNGNWQDINQWYSSQGEAGEGYFYPATPLGRFPNPATDSVFMTQYVTSLAGTYNTTTNAWTTGTYAGPIVYGRFDDPNCTWSGTLTNLAQFYRGTFTGNLSGLTSLGIYGGTFTNTVIFPTTGTGWSFGEYDSVGGVTPNTFTLPTGFSITDANYIEVYRSMTINFPITWTTSTGQRKLAVYSGQLTKQFPVFTRDMSTAATGCRDYFLIGSARSGMPNVPLNLSTLFTNSATFTIGTPTEAAAFTFYDIQATRPTVVYTGLREDWSRAGNFDSNYFGQGYLSYVYSQFQLLTPQGYTIGVVGASPFMTATYVVTATVAISLSTQGTKTIVDLNTLPYGYSFGPVYLGGFSPTINLAVTANVGAMLE